METVSKRCWPEDIALSRRHKSKWGLQVMTEFDILGDQDVLRGSPPLSEDGSWEQDMAVWKSSHDAKFAEDVKEELQNVYEPARPAAKGAEMHNLWHPSQFTEDEAGYMICTLCAVRLSCGQEAMHGRGRRHSVKAFLAGKTPIAQCRGIKAFCWYGCSCGRWSIRTDSCRQWQ